mmetsp:Transcript_49803/g.74274  ORF Transcript_49803/g.74274 Transcript_49803/m.74274 type:complete len:82 (-) Transcript_49803:41-286(-)
MVRMAPTVTRQRLTRMGHSGEILVKPLRQGLLEAIWKQHVIPRQLKHSLDLVGDGDQCRRAAFGCGVFGGAGAGRFLLTSG